MKKIFEQPSMKISCFSDEKIVIGSGLTAGKTKSLLENSNSGVSLDGKNGNLIDNLLSIDF